MVFNKEWTYFCSSVLFINPGEFPWIACDTRSSGDFDSGKDTMESGERGKS